MHRQAIRVSRAAQGWAGLTARERQVVEQLGTGVSDREIARALAVSEHTVHKHLQHVYGKLGVGSRAEVLAAVLAGEPPPAAAPSGSVAGAPRPWAQDAASVQETS
ncbi:response regulator transcription factor [Krasilnikovia cinnamomea]|uniref:response regulator transcription factor n=1 Tax=Krasilnikovia cinnamomea TaxID=349313 RepID=UPI003BF84B73